MQQQFEIVDEARAELTGGSRRTQSKHHLLRKFLEAPSSDLDGPSFLLRSWSSRMEVPSFFLEASGFEREQLSFFLKRLSFNLKVPSFEREGRSLEGESIAEQLGNCFLLIQKGDRAPPDLLWLGYRACDPP